MGFQPFTFSLLLTVHVRYLLGQGNMILKILYRSIFPWGSRQQSNPHPAGWKELWNHLQLYIYSSLYSGPWNFLNSYMYFSLLWRISLWKINHLKVDCTLIFSCSQGAGTIWRLKLYSCMNCRNIDPMIINLHFLLYYY